ncbi:MAG: tetratricopeptide repeat protein [Prevotella sp.]|nr:tetratricopeptide repeat protein [Prevotella sp.]
MRIRHLLAAVVCAVVVSSCSAAWAPILIGGACGAIAPFVNFEQQTNYPTKAKADKDRKKIVVNTPTIEIPPLSHEDSLRFNYVFLEAVRQQNAGNYDAAYELFTRASKINPYAAEVWYYLALYQGELDNDSLAVECLEKAAELSPQNDIYQERLAQYYIGVKQFDRAKTVYERLADNNRDRTDVLSILLRLYQQDNEYGQMLSTINRIEEIEGSSEEITLTKMRVYELMGDKNGAWNALKTLSDEHPSDLNYRVMMGNWLMQNDKQKEAFKIFSAALKEEPDNSYVQSSMYDYYRITGQDSLAQQTLESIVTSPKTPTESKATMMRLAIQQSEKEMGDSTRILALFDRIMEASPTDADMAEMKVAYMTLKNMPDSVVKTGLLQILQIAPENAGARIQLLQMALSKMDWDETIDICEDGTLYNPDEMPFYYYLGLANYQKEDHDAALDAFRRGVSQITPQSNVDIVSDFYYFMGDILYSKGREEEAMAAYDSCLQWKDDNIPCLNNYAYYLSVKGRELQKAEQMSYKTVKEEPKNSTYLDTYAWILFMQERYAEAKIYIDQAISCDSDSVQSGVIIEHAGDIYAMNGDIDKAVEYWQKALDKGVDSPMLPRKIKERKYIK